jgi:hypothetical protein
MAMTNLVQAYQENNVHEAEKIIRGARRHRVLTR